MNKNTLQDKTNYLYAFEAEFSKLCRAAGIDVCRWQTGMWTNAHMHYGVLSAEDGAAKWFEHVSTHSVRSK